MPFAPYEIRSDGVPVAAARVAKNPPENPVANIVRKSYLAFIPRYEYPDCLGANCSMSERFKAGCLNMGTQFLDVLKK